MHKVLPSLVVNVNISMIKRKYIYSTFLTVTLLFSIHPLIFVLESVQEPLVVQHLHLQAQLLLKEATCLQQGRFRELLPILLPCRVMPGKW